jgi:hypothetical protein
MSQIQLAKDIITTYERHGWTLRRVLLCMTTREELKDAGAVFGDSPLLDAEFDALWFARPSHAKREAWELRLISEQPYALFEAFEANESEEDREDARREMENLMRDNARKGDSIADL